MRIRLGLIALVGFVSAAPAVFILAFWGIKAGIAFAAGVLCTVLIAMILSCLVVASDGHDMG